MNPEHALHRQLERIDAHRPPADDLATFIACSSLPFVILVSGLLCGGIGPILFGLSMSRWPGFVRLTAAMSWPSGMFRRRGDLDRGHPRARPSRRPEAHRRGDDGAARSFKALGEDFLDAVQGAGRTYHGTGSYVELMGHQSVQAAREDDAELACR